MQKEPDEHTGPEDPAQLFCGTAAGLSVQEETGRVLPCAESGEMTK